jgi:hypothetical protein
MTIQLYQYLQQLSLSSGKKQSIDLPPKEKEEAWQIVWDAFLNGDFQQITVIVVNIDTVVWSLVISH